MARVRSRERRGSPQIRGSPLANRALAQRIAGIHRHGAATRIAWGCGKLSIVIARPHRARAAAAAAAALALAGCGAAAPKSAAPTAAAAATRRSPARRAPLARCTGRPTSCSSGGTRAFSARLRRCADIRWSSTSGPQWCAPVPQRVSRLQRVSVQLGRQVAFVGLDGKDFPGPAAAFLRQFPVSYPSYQDHDEDHRPQPPGEHVLSRDDLPGPQRAPGVRPRRSVRQPGRAHPRHPLLRPAMSTGIAFEVRRARSAEELAAALRLRHAVFCVEQGVPEHEELDGRDGEGIHLVAIERRRAARHLPGADRRVDGPVQPPGGPA